jgi:hypothetical protein
MAVAVSGGFFCARRLPAVPRVVGLKQDLRRRRFNVKMVRANVMPKSLWADAPRFSCGGRDGFYRAS